MARIFLSYAREDLEAAQAFSTTFEQAGHEVWWDHQLRAGSRFSWDIDAALRAAEAVVVLWSTSSVQSAWVQDEAAEGLEGSRLVPVALDGTKPPLGFRQYHTIDVANWRGGRAAFDDLLAAIEAISSGAPNSPPPARSATVRKQPTICVLPFTNKSGDREQDYFSDGITDDVITDLSKISALEVIGHNVSLGFHGKAPDLEDLKRLGITHVVEGSVRKAGSRVRIAAELVEAGAGRTVWADRYDRELSDVFAIQDEISHAIVEALQLTLLPDEKSAIAEGRTSSAEAYDLYLRARRLWPAGATGHYRRNEEIVPLCAEATAIDPKYANAWALMALAASELRFWQAANLDPSSAAQRAIELDPRMPEPNCVLARLLEERGKQDEAEAAVGDALSLNPDSWEAHCGAAGLLFRCGELGRAIPHFEKAVETGWKDHSSASALISCYMAAGDAAATRRAAEMSVAWSEYFVISDPTNGSAFASAARGLAALEEFDRARKWIKKALSVDPGNLSMRYSLAATAAGIIKDERQALEIIEPFAEAARYPPHLMLLERDPSWVSLRDSAEFESLLERARKRVHALAGNAVSY